MVWVRARKGDASVIIKFRSDFINTIGAGNISCVNARNNLASLFISNFLQFETNFEFIKNNIWCHR